MKIQKNYIYIALLLFLFQGQVFGSSGEIVEEIQKKSITEINSNIQQLEQERTTLSDKWSFLKNQHGGISAFIKQNLTNEEASDLEEITYIYNSKRKALNIQLAEKVKNFQDTETVTSELLELKKIFYKDLANYVETDQLDNFLEYIRNDIELNEKNREVKQELYKEKVVLQEKVDTIKQRIERHQKLINERIERLIHQKLTENISNLKQKPRYQELTGEGKIFFFEKALEKASKKKSELKSIENRTSIIQKKIELYEIVEEALKKEVGLLVEKKQEQ